MQRIAPGIIVILLRPAQRLLQLLMEFDDIYIIDLHGSSKKHEIAPDGGKDENVFDILALSK